MRARLALYASGVMVELREVALRYKPSSMLEASPKGSVPVLVLPDGRVIDESWNIMQWALQQGDPDGWLGENSIYIDAATPLLFENDTIFKTNLDRYKYADRYPEYPQIHYRCAAESFLQQLECRLGTAHFLLGDTMSIADVAIFPFIRQFSVVDKGWFAQAPYPLLRRWLEIFLSSENFSAVMKKYPVWHPGDSVLILSNIPN